MICCRNEPAPFHSGGEKKRETRLWMRRWGWKVLMRMIWCGGGGWRRRGWGGGDVRTAAKSPSVCWCEGAVYLRVRSEIKVKKTQQIMRQHGSSHFKIHRHADAAPCCCVMLSLWLQDVKPCVHRTAVCAFLGIRHREPMCSSWANRPPMGVCCFLLNDIFLR